MRDKIKYSSVVIILALSAIILFAVYCTQTDFDDPIYAYYTLTTAAAPTDGGSVSRSQYQERYRSGSHITVTAEATAGYRFAGWTGASESEDESVTVTMDTDKSLTANFELYEPERSSEKAITSFYFLSPPALGVINEDDKTISVEVPVGTDVTNLTPIIIFSGSAAVNPASGTAQNFSDTVTYTVTAEDGSEARYRVTVTEQTIMAYRLNVSRNLNRGGNVRVNDEQQSNPGQSIHIAGTLIILAAMPNANNGFMFQNWTAVSGALPSFTSGSDTTLTVAFYIDDNVDIMANFRHTCAVYDPETQFCDYRDGTIYGFVTIDTQKWMAENLNYIPESGNSWCYDGVADSCDKYGKLYDWSTAMGLGSSYNSASWPGSDVNHRGICPPEWHLPSNAEWETLINYVGSDIAGKVLRSQTGWLSGGLSNVQGTDEHNFSALPGGQWTAGDFTDAGRRGHWWTVTQNSPTFALIRTMSNVSDNVLSGGENKNRGLSVRCVRDD